MSAAKTFRLGGAGGYSIRATGYAPMRQAPPVYARILFYFDGNATAEETCLADADPSSSLLLREAINTNVDASDRDYLYSLVAYASQFRKME